MFEQKIVKNLAEQRLDAVFQAINFHVERDPDPGFMTGLAGEALFLYVYGRFSGSTRSENLGFLALERALDMINKGFSWPSYAAGLAGIRFTLRYLAANGYIPATDGAALDGIDPYMNEFASGRFKQGDFDLLHGALGMYIGGLKGDSRMVKAMHSIAVNTGPGRIGWESKHPQTGAAEMNLGLAHGLPSILWMLSHAKATQQRNELIEKGVAYLLSCRLENAPNGSLFPHRMVNGLPDQSGRLAWCYGDPGVGAALWQIGQNCGRPDWRADAIGILHKAASRRDAEANRVTDACLCHGTAGLALIFYKMAILTGHDELLDAAEYWTRATLDHGRNEGAVAGYLFLTTGNRYISAHSLLEGITGVGLTLMALLDADTLGWEQGLLL